MFRGDDGFRATEEDVSLLFTNDRFQAGFFHLARFEGLGDCAFDSCDCMIQPP